MIYLSIVMAIVNLWLARMYLCQAEVHPSGIKAQLYLRRAPGGYD